MIHHLGNTIKLWILRNYELSYNAIFYAKLINLFRHKIFTIICFKKFQLCIVGISIVSLYVWLFYNTSLFWGQTQLKGLEMPKKRQFPKIRLHHIQWINKFVIQIFTMLFTYIHQWISWIECACKIFFSYMWQMHPTQSTHPKVVC
jgi:hypothetical protein